MITETRADYGLRITMHLGMIQMVEMFVPNNQKFYFQSVPSIIMTCGEQIFRKDDQPTMLRKYHFLRKSVGY